MARFGLWHPQIGRRYMTDSAKHQDSVTVIQMNDGQVSYEYDFLPGHSFVTDVPGFACYFLPEKQ